MKKDFITVLPDSGRGDAQVQVTADVNPSFASRETTINFNANGQVLKSVKAVQDGMPFIVQMGMGCTGGKNLQIREFGLTGRNSSFPPVIQGRLLGGVNKTPANYTFFPSVGALVSFFTDTSDDLIIDFQWMNGSGTVLSSWYTTIPFDNEDGEDWRNYAEEIEASNTSPDSDATRLEIRIGVGRGDIGIDENQVWVRYHFDLT